MRLVRNKFVMGWNDPTARNKWCCVNENNSRGNSLESFCEKAYPATVEPGRTVPTFELINASGDKGLSIDQLCPVCVIALVTDTVPTVTTY